MREKKECPFVRAAVQAEAARRRESGNWPDWSAAYEAALEDVGLCSAERCAVWNGEAGECGVLALSLALQGIAECVT